MTLTKPRQISPAGSLRPQCRGTGSAAAGVGGALGARRKQTVGWRAFNFALGRSMSFIFAERPRHFAYIRLRPRWKSSREELPESVHKTSSALTAGQKLKLVLPPITGLSSTARVQLDRRFLPHTATIAMKSPSSSCIPRRPRPAISFSSPGPRFRPSGAGPRMGSSETGTPQFVVMTSR
jgi:hypothetical protein